MHQAGESPTTRYWLSETAITRPNVIALTELMVNPGAPFVLPGNRLGRVQSVEVRISDQIWCGVQFCRIRDCRWVQHAGRDFVTWCARGLNSIICGQGVSGTVTHEGLIAEPSRTACVSYHAEG